MPQSTKKTTPSQPTPTSPQVKFFLWGSAGLIAAAAIFFIVGSVLLLFRPRAVNTDIAGTINKVEKTIIKQEELSEPNLLVTKAPERQKITYPPITFIDPQLGPKDAPITIIEFSDFNCPYCAQAQTTLAELFKLYPGKIRLVWKSLPIRQLHPSAEVAAEAALCAGEQDKFWEYHDLLFINQNYFSESILIDFAKNLSLNIDNFSSCLTGGKMEPRVQKTLQEAKDLLINSTPHFYINKQEISGAADLEEFVGVVEAELGARE